MQKQIIKPLAVLLGTILFDFLFFKAFVGLNVLLITIFFETALFYFYRASFSKRNVQYVAIGTFILALCVVFTNSKLAVVAYLLSFSFLVGLIQLPELRFLFFGSLLFAGNFLEVPKHFANSLTNLFATHRTPYQRFPFLPIFMAIIIGSVFFFIYLVSNPRFADIVLPFFDALARIFTFRFDFGHFIFFGVCFFITGATIWKHQIFDFNSWQNKLSDNLISQQKNNLEINSLTNLTEYESNRLGIIVLGTVNLLLLLNNITDVPFVWFNNHINFSPADMKVFVHEGTYLLIFGILLAMGVLLWLFHGNIKTKKIFVEKKSNASLIDILAKIWLVQNAFLALSVGMRNAHYINAFGLAYKRIGVIFFLILVLCCLWFLYEKIKNSETFYRFVSRNAWSLYLVLVATSFVPWDTFITDYNIRHTPGKDLDVRFLMNDVSDKNTYQLIQNKNYLLQSAANSDMGLGDEIIYRGAIDKKVLGNVLEKEFDDLLSAKTARLHRKYAHNNWRSWNYPDEVNRQFLEKTGK